MKGIRLSPALVRSASVIAVAACMMAPVAAMAQDAPAKADAPVTEGQDEIVVSGIRASLERSIDIKRNSTGVVDAISAEDIGKFPDTNLAESLQRVTGVSINRVNGEGSQVTVRGFGPGYNLVTLNGRTLAATNIGVVGGDGNADGAQGTSRSFDFDNLASEGVRTLEVYKTARAAVPSGGIGASVNVITRRPLDGKGGFNGSIGAKAAYDSSTRDCIDCGSHVTPEVTGLLSWANDADNFGITLFGSYQKRNFSVASTGGNDWNIVPYSTFLGYTNASTQITGAPSNPNTLVAVPNDSRSDFSEDSRERINGQATVQFRPMDGFTITADALYARNRQSERRTDSGNWFNRPFDVVKFDGNPVINSAVYLHEVLNPTKDGPGSENQYRATKATLEDYGLNLDWDVTDNFNVKLDGHYSLADTLPDNPNGATSTAVAIAGYGVTSHSVDYSSGVPVQVFAFNDTAAAPGSTRQGNRNGTLDIGDIGTQVGRTWTSTQTQRLKEARVDFNWHIGGGSSLQFGGDYRTSNVRSAQSSTYQPLGDWGVANPGDVVALAPGQLIEFCLACKFHHYDLQATGNALKAYRVEDAAKLYSTLTSHFPAPSVSTADNRVKEDIWAGYGQFTWDGQIGDKKASLVAGVRYERTKSTSTSIQQVPSAVRWDADNDFTVVPSAATQSLVSSNTYGNFMPSVDFRIDLTPSLVGRVSAGRTIARTDYSNLFSATSVGGPGRPTAIGGIPSASSGNPNLIPLVSDNIDASLEWYIKPGSYLSFGVFGKRVQNFVGTGITQTSLFGLRDPSSGAAGSRSGSAKTALTGLGADISDVNLFTMTALIDQLGSVAAATAQFSAHYIPASHTVDQPFVDTILTAYNITGNASDPLYNFSLSRPINNRDVKVWGFELAGSYFLGNTGIGIAAAYTYVRSDAHFDNALDYNIDQFALVGLSDTANVTLIYDKHGVSARLAYNWRAKFLAQLNRDGYHNPTYSEPHGQFDLNISYDITPKFAVSFEGINLTEQGIRQYGRTEVELFFAQEQQRRFLLGARYKF